MSGQQALYIGIDLGTSGCRLCLLDQNRHILLEHSAALPASDCPEAGQAEQNPHDWWSAVSTCLQAASQAIPADSQLYIAVDGTSSSLLACDADANPLGPALMYNDTRSRDEAVQIDQVAPAESPARGPGSSLAKFMYLSKHYPDMHHAMHQADWILACLSGNAGISDDNNCLKLGFDPQTQAWPDWFAQLGIDTRYLPNPHRPGQPVATIKQEVVTQLGLPATTTLVAGTTDSNAAFLATGASEPGDAVSSLGSTLVLKILSDTPLYSASHGIYSHYLLGNWLVGGASNSGGAVLLEYFTVEEMIELTELMDPEQDTGLDYYPLPAAGERFPINDPDLPARLPDALPSGEAGRARVLQGLLEGISRIERQGYDLLHQIGAPYPKRVFSIGGGTANPAWTLIRQRYLGVPVIMAEQQQAAFGAALLAMQANT